MFSTSNFIGRTVRLGMARCRVCWQERDIDLGANAFRSRAPLPRKCLNVSDQPSSLGVSHGRAP